MLFIVDGCEHIPLVPWVLHCSRSHLRRRNDGPCCDVTTEPDSQTGIHRSMHVFGSADLPAGMAAGCSATPARSRLTAEALLCCWPCHLTTQAVDE